MSASFQFRQRKANGHHPLVNRGSQAQLLLSTTATTQLNFLASRKQVSTTIAPRWPTPRFFWTCRPSSATRSTNLLSPTRSRCITASPRAMEKNRTSTFPKHIPSKCTTKRLSNTTSSSTLTSSYLQRLLKFNDITFGINPDYLPSSDLLTAWVTSISVAKRFWIKTITIRYENMAPEQRYRSTDGPNTIARLTQVCNDVPSMRVKYHVPFWTWG